MDKTMKRIQACLAGVVIGVGVLVGVSMCSEAKAADISVSLGKTETLRAPACLTVEDMTAIAEADSKDGPEAAMALFKQNGNCGIAQGEFLLKSVKFSAPTKRGATTRVLEVSTELGDGSKLVFYILVDVQVNGATQT